MLLFLVVSVFPLALFLFVPYSHRMTKEPPTEAELAERKRIGATIKQLREMRGYTPDAFANEIQISRSYLANIEAGRKPLTERLLATMSTVLLVEQVVIVRDGYFHLAVQVPA